MVIRKDKLVAVKFDMVNGDVLYLGKRLGYVFDKLNVNTYSVVKDINDAIHYSVPPSDVYKSDGFIDHLKFAHWATAGHYSFNDLIHYIIAYPNSCREVSLVNIVSNAPDLICIAVGYSGLRMFVPKVDILNSIKGISMCASARKLNMFNLVKSSFSGPFDGYPDYSSLSFDGARDMLNQVICNLRYVCSDMINADFIQYCIDEHNVTYSCGKFYTASVDGDVCIGLPILIMSSDGSYTVQDGELYEEDNGRYNDDHFGNLL